jgi:hypothetical protein
MPVLKGTIALLLVYSLVETAVNVVPRFNVIFDSLWGDFVFARAIVLVVGVIAYIILTVVANRIAQKRFEKVSL